MEPGQMVTVEWRGKPVYVVRRTPEAMKTLEDVTGRLRDPASEKSAQPAYAKNAGRSIKEEFLVLLGVCTHLGCAPEYKPEVGAEDVGDSNWLGGFFCKCHGSKFDLAGRVFQGVPAPLNLEIPPYMFLSDDILLIGDDQEA
jgi:ubiquinol-cytochrome c reductase iron-sulfur subunit